MRSHGPSTLTVMVGGPPPVAALPAPAEPAGVADSTLTCLRRLRWSIPAALAAAAICCGAVTYWIEIAGFESVCFQRCDLPLKIGHDLDHAVEFNMALGPAGEVLRLWEDRIDEIRPKIAAELRDALNDLDGPNGVYAPASTWIISAKAPQ